MGGNCREKIIMWASAIDTRAVCRYNMCIQERDANRGKKMTTNQIITTVAVAGITTALNKTGKGGKVCWLMVEYGVFARRASNKTVVTIGETFTIKTINATKTVNALTALKTINALNAM